MFPFGDDPSFIKRPPFHLFDQIPNPPLLSKHDDSASGANSPFFPNFPSPFFDEHELPLNQIFPKPPIIPISSKKESPKLKNKSAAAPPRKKTGKKDRHSKICTAQGIRDRRMRLSLQVARKFFDLQDMLGYDKASKTIEWLFTKSKKAIKELAKDAGNSISATTSGDSFVSECEVISGIEEDCSNNNEAMKENETKAKKPTREAREKARARARCRTEEKMMIMGKKQQVESSPNLNVVEKLGSASRSSPNLEVAAEDYSPLVQVQPPSDAGTIEKLLGSSSSAAAAADSCCVDPSSSSGFMGFLGNWDLLSNDIHRLSYAGNNANPNSIYITPDFPLFHQ